LYHIDWANYQFETRDPSGHYPYETNGAGAKSEGIEISLTTKPWTGLVASAWFVYDNAELTQSLPPVSPAVGGAGDPLPSVPKYSGNVSINQEIVLPKSIVGFIGGQLSYVGDRKGEFVSTPIRQDFPAYTKLDFHVGVRFDSTEIRAYINNATNPRGLVGGGLGQYDPSIRQYITPRTIGVTATKSF
jgi:hypothetical protein